MPWEKNSVENVILFCFTEDEGFVDMKNFSMDDEIMYRFFVDKKKWKEYMEDMKKFSIDDDMKNFSMDDEIM